MRTKKDKELDNILWQSSIVCQLEGLKSQSEITEKLQEIVDARLNELVKESIEEQKVIDINKACDFLVEKQGECISIDLINDLVEAMKGK